MPTIITRGAASAQGFGYAKTGQNLVIGQAYGGGYYAGQIAYPTGQTYNLVVSPKASGQIGGVVWGPTGTNTSAQSYYDGAANTTALAALGSTYQAAYQCDNLTINGFSDWYLPAKLELEVLYWYFKPTADSNQTAVPSGANPYAVAPEPVSTNYTASSPAQTTVSSFQTGNSEAIEYAIYNSFMWTSTQYDTSTNNAWYQYFGSTQPGKQQNEFKNTSGVARAIRRVAA